MCATAPSDQLVRVVPMTPEVLPAFAGVVEGLGAAGGVGGERLVGVYLVLARDGATSAGAGPRYVFARAGNDWRVVFEGGQAFYLRDALGPRYLNYLLHHENETIRALNLEKEIQPEKVRARASGSIQRTLEGAAARAKLQELEALRAEREEARDAGDEGRVSQLDGKIEKGEAELEGVQPGDAGQKARCNVSQAVKAVRRKLERGNRKQRAFAEHLKQCLSLGFECMYIQPAGKIWR